MNLKQLRKSKKLTQVQAAELCGLSRKGYQNIEEGKNKKKGSSTLLYCVARLEEYSSAKSRTLTRREIEKTVIPYFRSIGSSFLYLMGEEEITLFGDFSLSPFDQAALENEIEMRLGRSVRLSDFSSATKDEVKKALALGMRLYPKGKDH